MGRKRSALLVIIGLLLIGAVFAAPSGKAASEQCDLAFQEAPEGCLRVSAFEISKGGTLQAWVTVMNRYGGRVESFDVGFYWRRIDKQETCDFTSVTISALAPGELRILAVQLDTSDLTPGTYEVSALLDPDNDISENDETNNRCSIQIKILPPRPELHPVGLSIEPASPIKFGETVRFSAELENTGDSRAGEFSVRFWLTPIRGFDEERGETFSIIVDKRAGSDPSPISTFMFHTITDAPPQDPAYATSEIEAIPSDQWVQFGSAVVAGLDRDTRVSVDDVLDSATQLDELLRLLLYPDSKSIGNLTDEQRGAFAADLERLRASQITYAIKAEIEKPEGLAELDPWNNAILGYVTIRPSELHLPELRPVSVTFTHDLPAEWNRDIGVYVLITNVGGSVAASAPGDEKIRVFFYLRRVGSEMGGFPQNPTKEDTIDPIRIEEGYNTVEAFAQLSFDKPGSYELLIWVDALDVIHELNEDNNKMIVGFSVEGCELHPTSIELGPGPVRQGDTISVISQIENTGKKTAETFTVGFFIDNVRFDTAYYRGGGLTEDEQVRVQGTLNTSDLPPANYNLRIVVDPDNQIPELDEANNVMSTPLVILDPVPRLAELHPMEISLTPHSPVSEGESINVSTAIRNTGSIDAEHFQVEISITHAIDDENPLASASLAAMQPVYVVRRDVDGLAHGAKQVIREDAITTDRWPQGCYVLQVTVDPKSDAAAKRWGEVREMDESNNAMRISFRLGPPPPLPSEVPGAGWEDSDRPNLVLQDLTLKPSYAADVGVPLWICGTVANTGRKAAGPFQVDLFWIGPSGAASKFASQRITGLGVGQTLLLDCKPLETAVSLGTYQGKGVVDAKNEIEEQNEADNARTVSVVIQGGVSVKPDLSPISLRLAPSSSVSRGDMLSVYVTVKNLGALATGSFDIAYERASTTDGPKSTSLGSVPGLGPREEHELWQALDTSAVGTYTLTITVDPDDRISEVDERNNVITGQFTVKDLPPIKVEKVLKAGGAVRLLEIEESTGTVYVTSNDGHLRAIARGDPPQELFDIPVEAGSAITAFAIDTGSARAAYVGTDKGTVFAIGLDTGDPITEPVSVAARIFALALDNAGNIYAGTDQGLIRFDRDLQVVNQSEENVGEVSALVVDDLRDTIYAITPTALRAFGFDCAPLCEFSNMRGTPSALAIDLGAVYVGTEAGMFYAFDFCDPRGRIRQKYVFPSEGAIEGAITSITVDLKRDPVFDPIYVASSAGKLYALDLEGGLAWTFPAGEDEKIGGIHSVPTIDNRRGLIFFGDDNGRPYVLKSDGAIALDVELGESELGAIRSTPVIDVAIEHDDTGTRLVYTFFYGADDGYLYMIQTDR
jgi:subtilase family serine protease